MQYSTTAAHDTPVETIYGHIVSKANNYQAVPDGSGGRRIIKTEKLRRYEQSFIRQCKTYAGRRIDHNFELIVVVYFPSARCDLDNSLKTLLDCLQYVGAITDDNLCTRIVADKLIDKYAPRVEFSLIPEPRVITPSLFDF